MSLAHVTIWTRLTRTMTPSGPRLSAEHNHYTPGWDAGAKPTGTPEQTRAWAGLSWSKARGVLLPRAGMAPRLVSLAELFNELRVPR